MKNLINILYFLFIEIEFIFKESYRFVGFLILLFDSTCARYGKPKLTLRT